METPLQSMVGVAFLVGVVSAASLPLGALTATRSQFSDRVVAFLRAFGGGALLATLTIDLVARAVEAGHLAAVSFGWLLGGTLFIQLNSIVNDLGGFSRKVSTTIYQLRRREHRQFRHLVKNLQRLDIFADLPKRDYEALRASVRPEQVKKGAYLFRKRDPARFMHIVFTAKSISSTPITRKPGPNDWARVTSWGASPFWRGKPNTSDARSATDCQVMKLPRQALFALLPNSPELIQAVHKWLRSRAVFDYLRGRQGLEADAVERWLSLAGASLHARGVFPDVLTAERNAARFFEVAPRIHTVGRFADLPDAELQTIMEVLTYKRHAPGHTFHFKGEWADRLYILDEGEVALIDPAAKQWAPVLLQGGDAFGFMGFATGTKHSVNAVASADSKLWVLLRSDFDALLPRLPFRQAARGVRRGSGDGGLPGVPARVFAGDAAIWTRRALEAVRKQLPLPRARAPWSTTSPTTRGRCLRSGSAWCSTAFRRPWSSVRGSRVRDSAPP